MIRLKTKKEIETLKKGGALLAQILDEVCLLVAPGVSTEHLNDEAVDCMERLGVEPVLLGYRPEFAPRPYPAAICTSVNDVVVHGIPNENPITLKEGDIVGIDVSIRYEGLIVDMARTLPVGSIDPSVRKLLSVTREALAVGIRAAQSGKHIGDIGHTIETFVRPHGYGIVEELCGHGVGYALHEEPMVQNVGAPDTGPEIEPGLVIAIEPMLTLGNKRVVFDKKDGYTVRTKDHSLSAHFEHSIAVTENGPAILTIIR